MKSLNCKKIRLLYPGVVGYKGSCRPKLTSNPLLTSWKGGEIMEDTERFIAFLQDFALSEWGDDLKHRLHKNGVEIKNLDDAYQKNPKVAKIVQEYAKIFDLAALLELIGHRAPTFTFIN